jgi:transposase
MDLMKVAEVVASEEAALRRLMEVGLVERVERCWACGGSRVVLVRRMSWKCRDCGRERSVRRGSLLARFQPLPRQFVLGLKLFEMEVSALRAAGELGVAYRTAWKLFTVLRQALAKAERGQELLSDEVEANKATLAGASEASEAGSTLLTRSSYRTLCRHKMSFLYPTRSCFFHETKAGSTERPPSIAVPKDRV